MPGIISSSYFCNSGKKYLQIFVFLSLSSLTAAQVKSPAKEGVPTPYYIDKTSMFNILPNTKGEIIFLGDSITDRCEWNELFLDVRIKNRGLSGDLTSGVINRLNEILESKPAQIFLMIGVNDLRNNIEFEIIVNNYAEIIRIIKEDSPSTEIIIQSVLPVNNIVKDAKTNNSSIKNLNAAINKIAANNNLKFIDLFSKLVDADGNLASHFTSDGLHINGEAYLIWKESIEPFVKL